MDWECDWEKDFEIVKEVFWKHWIKEGTPRLLKRSSNNKIIVIYIINLRKLFRFKMRVSNLVNII